MGIPVPCCYSSSRPEAPVEARSVCGGETFAMERESTLRAGVVLTLVVEIENYDRPWRMALFVALCLPFSAGFSALQRPDEPSEGATVCFVSILCRRVCVCASQCAFVRLRFLSNFQAETPPRSRL